MMTREKIDALTEPSRSYDLTKRPGEPATLRIRFPGDIGGVELPKTYSYKILNRLTLFI